MGRSLFAETRTEYRDRSTSPTSDKWRYSDFAWVKAKRVPFELSVSPARPAAGEKVTFTVTNGGIGTSAISKPAPGA